jgi:DNA end-binding protein Ku
MGTLLRYPYEVREEHEVFDEIPNEHVPKDMLDLAVHIVKSKTGHFRPEKFEDRYENALRELIARKEKGEKLEPAPEPEPTNVINLMDALRRSIQGKARAQEPKSARKKASKAAGKKPAGHKKAAPKKASAKRKTPRAA